MEQIKITLSPTEDHIIVIPDRPPKMTKSGLHLPDNESLRSQPASGIVAKVGDGRFTNEGGVIPILIDEGVRVFYPPYSGDLIEIEDRKHVRVMRETDVIAWDSAEVPYPSIEPETKKEGDEGGSSSET